MKLRRILVMTTLFLIAATVTAHASLTLTLYDGNNSATGNLFAAPGATVGWGLKVQNDNTGYALINSSDFIFTGGSDLRSSPTTSAYTDFVGSLNVVLAPLDSYTQYYDPILFLGAGSISIGNFQSGLTMFGEIRVGYDNSIVDPSDPLFNPDNNSPGSDSASASVTTTASAVPEPSTCTLFGLGLGGLAFWKRRQRRA